MNEKLIVGIADMKIAQNGDSLITYALGSCIGVCLWDPGIKIGALLHIMLPTNMEAGGGNLLKYADSGVKETIRQLELRGASRQRLTAKIAGGAKMFEMKGPGGLGNIGQRNAVSVHLALKAANIRLVAEDVGGTVARTLEFDPATGQATIRSYGRPEKIL